MWHRHSCLCPGRSRRRYGLARVPIFVHSYSYTNDAAAEEADAAQEVAVGDAGGTEDDVVPRGQLRGVVDLGAVDVAHRLQALLLPLLQRLEAALHPAVETAHGRRGQDAFRRAADAHGRVDAGTANGRGD